MTDTVDHASDNASEAAGTDAPDAAATPSGNNRRTIVSFVIGAALLIALGLVYLAWASSRVDDDIAAREARAQAAIDDFEDATDPSVDGDASGVSDDATTGAAADGPVLEPGTVLVVHRVPGDDYGRLAIRHDDGTRTLLDRKCERVHAAADLGVCLARDEAVLVPSFRTEFFRADTPGLPEIRSYNSPLPSRARVSPTGLWTSTTGFVSGSSYADIGGDTQTLVTVDQADDRRALAGLVQFEILDAGGAYEGAERQFWGLSFVDDDDFWVTGFFGEQPELLTGTISRRVLNTTGIIGSCPSLSPDGKHLVYKYGPDDSYRLTVRNLETGEEWPLGEDRSVDDQVEWLDDDTILYSIHPDGTDGSDALPQFDIWKLDIAPGSVPELFLPAANSPAVVR